ncbi:unnamed protein product [Durusdinium trenchii]|uniref:Uncharacterized protein n=1 Tax=Durusdinium trenchii TaxID=1381693 RepID=A0ABP0IE81_9DINO
MDNQELRDFKDFLCFRFVGALELCRMAPTHRRWCKTAQEDALWLELCRACWSTKVSSFHLTKRRQEELSSQGISWKEHYRQHLQDGGRSCITLEELTENVWDFTFRLHPQLRASSSFRFDPDSRCVTGHPNGLTYHWQLSADGHRVELGAFPQAKVIRRDDWGWAIANSNIVCCSLDAKDLAVPGAVDLHPQLFSLEQLAPSLQLVQLFCWPPGEESQSVGPSGQ